MTPLTFEPLASSSAGCAYRLSGGGSRAPLLIDCGLPYKKLQIALGFKVTQLAGCLVSHGHEDHCRAVRSLLGFGITCYASFEAWQAMDIGPLYVTKTRSIVRGWDDDAKKQLEHEEFCVGDWKVLPFDVPHDEQSGTLGYLIGAPSGEVCAYITDASYVPFRLADVNVLAIECNWSEEILKANLASGAVDRSVGHRVMQTHMSIERLEKMLAANDLSKCRQIFLMHLSQSNSDEAAFKERIQRLTGIPVTVCPA